MGQTSYKSFLELMQEIDEKEHTQRDRGTLFELLVAIYLEKEPLYAPLFDKVWKLSEVPAEYDIPRKDTGVDLVVRKRDSGELLAVQCKYYAKDKIIQKADIDSFLNEVGKKYYAGGIVVTSTDKWSNNADDALKFRDKDIFRISLSDLAESQVDWSSYSFREPKKVQLQSKKTPRPHQIPAIKAVVDGFEKTDRGKLIMAPGTGKTYTSMAIAEKMAAEKIGVFRVLYLVPSIQLLSQTLRGWNADISYSMDSIAVCSDRKVTKAKGENEIEDIAAADLGYPATTNHEKLLDYQKQIETKEDKSEILTVFSTYQSIDVIIEAQKKGFYEFDLVICDEAHRTTGATELGDESSAFVKVHDDANIKTNKRLYQTATPRVYGEDAKKKAEEKSVLIADMSDVEIYGEEFYRLGFGDAIRRGILTDYKVMILAVDEEAIDRQFQHMLAQEDELKFNDVTKIVGCWNGLVKRDGNTNKTLGAPMKRAIAFTGTIKESKLITEMFSRVVDEYLNEDPSVDPFNIEIQHADGSMNALQKNEKISWLKSDVPDNTCRVLSNARFLTEGVDVPDLDAVMFLKPRRSKIDIAQAVGRVMRKAEGKEYGYVILPIGIPSGMDPNSVLDNHEQYKVVWEVLNALRSLDERFDATINKLELNKKKPGAIQVIGVGKGPTNKLEPPASKQLELSLTEEEWSELERAIYGKIVRKVGNVRYWEQWSEDVADIARKHIMRIQTILEDKDSETYKEFSKFLRGLRHNINNSITRDQAIEMLAQHLITRPVFEALFDSYSFVHNNPVSKAMNTILSILGEQGLLKEQEDLEDFYESVRIRADGIDNLKAKQDIIVQLYDKFFRVGFKETTARLGIVFTPVEIVDFIIHSIDDVLKNHFGKSLTSKGVHVLDPFTGTGTFIARLLQSGLINKEDLIRKYTQELHANEIVLLSYYIAAINIEETFHSITGGEYSPFEGIVLTDTFESTENKDSFLDELFNENNTRLKKQNQEPIFAIIGNPPYSIGQTSVNDNNQNNSYPLLENRIEQTYAKHSKANLKKALYDSYFKAYRWASDRIEKQGVVAFITPNSVLDKPSLDGFRKSLNIEFNHVYAINLRGAVRGRLGDDAKKEGQSVFNILTGTAIMILVKDGSDEHTINYYDIGDYLTRTEKLNKLNSLNSMNNIDWTRIVPDSNNNWINQGDASYETHPSILNDIFLDKAVGVSTSRDIWVYGFSKDKLQAITHSLVENYNSEIDRLSKIKDPKEKIAKRNMDDSFIKWSVGLTDSFSRSKKFVLDNDSIRLGMYRPFCKKWLFYDKNIIERPGRWSDIMYQNNKIICTTGVGARRDFSALVVQNIPNYDMMEKTQGYYLNKSMESQELFDNMYNFNESFMNSIGLNEEDLFYYIYAILHWPEYKKLYSDNLNKSIPRIPIVNKKERFVEVGRKLVDLHINYEAVPAYNNLTIDKKVNASYRVVKMKYTKRNKKDSITFNPDITISDIPEKAYEYIVNGRSAIEWIMDQYKVNRKSGIVDDPNAYSKDEKYIFNLLLSVINVSVQTVDLVNSLPPLD